MKAMQIEQLLLQQLRDLYSSESQQIDMLAAMMDGAGTPELKAVIMLHLNQTINHLNRIEEMSKAIQASPRGKHCAALEVLSRQCFDILQDPVAAPFRENGIMDFAQQIDDYEIAGYTASLGYARELGMEEVCLLIRRTLAEEQEMSRLVGEMAHELELQQREAATRDALVFDENTQIAG